MDIHDRQTIRAAGKAMDSRPPLASTVESETLDPIDIITRQFAHRAVISAGLTTKRDFFRDTWPAKSSRNSSPRSIPALIMKELCYCLVREILSFESRELRLREGNGSLRRNDGPWTITSLTLVHCTRRIRGDKKEEEIKQAIPVSGREWIFIKNLLSLFSGYRGARKFYFLTEKN